MPAAPGKYNKTTVPLADIPEGRPPNGIILIYCLRFLQTRPKYFQIYEQKFLPDHNYIACNLFPGPEAGPPCVLGHRSPVP